MTTLNVILGGALIVCLSSFVILGALCGESIRRLKARLTEQAYRERDFVRVLGTLALLGTVNIEPLAEFYNDVTHTSVDPRRYIVRFSGPDGWRHGALLAAAALAPLLALETLRYPRGPAV